MILVVANTIIGKQGNIGYRIGKVLTSGPDLDYFVLARGLSGGYRGYSFGIFGLISRCLNGVRRYILPRFNSRRYDIMLFNIVCIIYYVLLVKRRYQIKTVYVCETSSFLIRYFKKEGYKIVLDVAIAPSSHIISILDKYPLKGIYYNSYLNQQESESFQLAHTIIVPSEYIAKILRDRGFGASVRKIPFGTDFDEKLTTATYQKKKENEFVTFGYLGNISPRKGSEQLLEGWQKGADRICNKLILQGRLYPSLRYIHKIENVEIRKFGDKIAFYEDIDVLILPSFMEGSAKVIYEAVAHGIPVYASEFSGAPFFDQYGIHLLSGIDAFSIASDIKKISKSYKGRLNIRYVKSFQEQYSWKNYSQRVGLLLK